MNLVRSRRSADNFLEPCCYHADADRSERCEYEVERKPQTTSGQMCRGSGQHHKSKQRDRESSQRRIPATDSNDSHECEPPEHSKDFEVHGEQARIQVHRLAEGKWRTSVNY